MAFIFQRTKPGTSRQFGRMLLVANVLLFFIVQEASCRAWGGSKSKRQICGYESCNPVKEGMLNVHLVPHSHDDVGWLKTVNQYYYGTYSYIQQAAVHSILETASQSLLADPQRRFIFVEMAFMNQWWNDKTDYKKRQVRDLINAGRLEIALGAWAMADEAVTHYTALIEEHTRGFKFLEKNFGACARPRVGWQVDPFGHSKEVAALFAQFGYDGLFFGRLDYQDKDQRSSNKSMEMLWRASESLGNKANLFTGVLFNNYNYPEGLCWDEYCRAEPIVEKRELPGFNGDQFVDKFFRVATDQQQSYATRHIIFTMGADFHYSNAENWFTNLDKLIALVNEKQKEGSNINALYSTPSCYLYHLNQQNMTWPEKTDDFFPYAHKPNAFWTGYYTSRAAFKSYVRQSNNILKACKQVNALAKLRENKLVDKLWREFSIVQHHDAITGTAKQQVDNDYRKRLAEGIESCQTVMGDAYKKWLRTKGNLEHYFCNHLNISYCKITETYTEFLVTLYNPLAHNVTHWVRIPVVARNAFKVLNVDNEKVPVQLIKLMNSTQQIPEHQNSKATHELIFRAYLPALGYTTYFVRNTKKPVSSQLSVESKLSHSNKIISNQFIEMEFSHWTGLPVRLTNKHKQITSTFQQSLMYYKSALNYDQPSGPYIFRPEDNRPNVFNFNATDVTIFTGPLVTEVYLEYSSWAKQVLRLYNDSITVEMEWTVGPIPLDNYQGKEVITDYLTGLNNNREIFTDANSRQMMHRRYNYRPSWNFRNTENVAGNYYPITSQAFIKDVSRDVQFTVFVDRAEGGGSIKNGSIEIMLHRRGTKDDMLGVGEPLDERGVDGDALVVRGKHQLLLDTKEASTHYHRLKSLMILNEPIISFMRVNRKMRSKFNLEWSALKRALPREINLLTFEEWEGKMYLLRLEHIYELHEVNCSVKVDLKDLFKNINIVQLTEMTLGGNMELSELNRLKWKSANLDKVQNEYADRIPPNGLEITLKPMEIRTFKILVE